MPGVARTIGVKVNVLTPDEVKAIWPLCETDGLIGAIQHPDDGYIQPADLTQALRQGRAGARRRDQPPHHRDGDRGATPPANGWSGPTRATSSASTSSPPPATSPARTGAMVGLDIPVIPVEHQYIVTEPHPAIDRAPEAGPAGDGRAPRVRLVLVLREENGGLLLGPYEKGAPACYVDGPREDAEYELFQEDLDRLAPHIETAIARVPAFGEVGVKKVYNGAIAYTPDGSPIVGPAWGVRNFWLNEGHTFGVTAAGGAGWQLAEWIVEGEPSIDMLGVDPRRFGPYATHGYLKAKNEEAYSPTSSPSTIRTRSGSRRGP